MIRQAAIALFSVAALAACNPYDPDLPNRPFLCGGDDDDKCPEGYTCSDEMICEKVDTSADPDATASFQCADDGDVEPNDLPTAAFRTPIPQASRNYSLVNMAVCPPGDKDHYRFTVDAVAPPTSTKLEVTVTGLANKAPLSVSLLNSQGSTIATGSPVAGMTYRVQLADQNLALGAGDYVVRVIAQNPDDQNNYDLTIKTCDAPLPCP